MKSILVSGMLVLTGLVITFTALAASVGESAGEIWVDGPAPQPGSDPNQPDAAVDHMGRSIFVWDGTPADTNTRKDIFVRIFDADGNSEVGPLQVNTYVDDAQDYPKLAVSGDGSFLVTWLSAEEPEPGDGFLRDVIRSQAFDSDANPVGDEQLLSTLDPLLTTANKVDLAALPDGNYIVVWRSSQSANQNDTSTTIQGRLVGPNGSPLAGQFQVNSLMTSQSESWPAVTALGDGGFLVVWTVPEVHGRRFNADTTPVGEDFQINTYTNGTESRTDVARNGDGRIAVVWQDGEESGENDEIRGRVFDENLVAQDSDFRINTLITGVQQEPEVAEYGKGGFFVVWESWVSAGDDVDPRSIEGRIVTGGNKFASPQFMVNEWTGDSQHHPGIGGKGGRIAVGWHSQSNPETSSNVINGQFWSICGIFCDGFE